MYFGKISGVPVIAVAPHYSSQNCLNCGEQVKKPLSLRKHGESILGLLADRDLNTALNILIKALSTVGHRKLTPGERPTWSAQLVTTEHKPTRIARKPK